MSEEKEMYSEIKIDTIDRFNLVCDYISKTTEPPLSYLLFRGQQNSSWTLRTSLERYREQIWENMIYPFSEDEDENNTKNDYCNRKPGDVKDKVMIKLFEFIPLARIQQVIHNFNIDFPIPAPESYADWFSLVQHYGGKSRLIDVTLSFYTASFFALNQYDPATQSDCQKLAIWVFNLHKSKDELLLCDNQNMTPDQNNTSKQFNNAFKHFKSNVLEESNTIDNYIVNKGISILIPNHMSKRMLHQSGCFVYGDNMLASFEDNLFNGQTYQDVRNQWSQKHDSLEWVKDLEKSKDLFRYPVTKIEIDCTEEKSGNALLKYMGLRIEMANINSMQLFPDIYGMMNHFYEEKKYHFVNWE